MTSNAALKGGGKGAHEADWGRFQHAEGGMTYLMIQTNCHEHISAGVSRVPDDAKSFLQRPASAGYSLVV